MLPLTEQTHQRVAASLPAWARTSAAAGFEAFSSLAMPDSRQEEWRYVEVDVDLDSAQLAEAPGTPLAADSAVATALGTPAGRAVNVDGHTVGVEAPAGVRLTSLAEALAADGEAVRGLFRSGPGPGLDRFAAADGEYNIIQAFRGKSSQLFRKIRFLLADQMMIPDV